MAAGVSDIGIFAGGTALDVGRSAGAVGGVVGAAAAATNPLSLGLGLLSGVGGLFGKSKSESNQSAAYSGIGGFNPNNNFDFSYSKPFFDLENPMHIAAAGGLILLAAFAYKKVK